MHQPIQLTNTIPSLRTRAPLWRGFLLISLAVGLPLLPAAQAVTPAPDGGYPDGNTAEGTDALSSLTSGTDNTAIGNLALFSTDTGIGNTATGGKALYGNRGSYNTATG